MAKKQRANARKKAPAPPAAPEPIRGDQELARLYGVSTKTVYSWRQNGLPFKSEGRIAIYDPAEASTWIEAYRKQTETDLTPASRVKLAREEARLRKDQLDADKAQREADAETGNILRRDEWELFAVEVVQQARDRFMRLPKLLCKHVPQKFHRIIQQEGEADVRKICDEMSRTLAQGAKD